MRYFNETITIMIDDNIMKKAKEFAENVVPTVGTRGVYRDTSQGDQQKIKHDHYVSKVGEEAVKQALQKFTENIVGPDYEIYTGNQKSWDSDLYVNEISLAVKTQSTDSAARFGLSWTFQSGSIRRDPILDLEDAWVSFVEFNEERKECYVYPPFQIKDLTFEDPKLEKLKGTKKVVYARNLSL